MYTNRLSKRPWILMQIRRLHSVIDKQPFHLYTSRYPRDDVCCDLKVLLDLFVSSWISIKCLLQNHFYGILFIHTQCHMVVRKKRN